MRRPSSWYGILANASTVLVLGALVVGAVLPFYWMGATSFKGNQELYTLASPLAVHQFTLTNYRGLLGTTPFWAWFVNSVVTSGASTLIALIFGALAAYGVSRFHSRAAQFAASLSLTAYLVPRSLFVIPLFQMMIGLHLLNTLTGLVASYLTFTLPFCIWYLTGFFQAVPTALDEAALVDGASYLQVLTKVVLPLARPGLVAATIFSFTTAWNEFMYPLVLTQVADKQTLTAGLASLQQGDVFVWGQIMAAGVLTSIPVIVFYGLIFRQVTGGLSAGAVKG
jgi:multiple sugar transport system permease protein